jgi:hypothetical protein
MKQSVIAIVILFAALIVVSSGCSGDPATGYTTASQFQENIRTIAIPIWTRGKDVYRRDIEIRLTEAIQKRVQQNTPYRLADRSRADSELTGELVNVTQQVLSTDPDTGRPNEIEAMFTLNFTWKDQHGRVLMKREKFQVSGTYIPQSPFNENFFEGSEDIINKIAMLVVEQMESDW